jgi:hypothetical protein
VVEDYQVAYGGYPDVDNIGKTAPLFPNEMASPFFKCGRLAFKSVDKTAIADVVAGEEVGFRTMLSHEVTRDLPEYAYSSFYPGGPAQIYLSRAPGDDLKKYEGDGDWFKVAYAGPKNNQQWKLFNPDAPVTDVSKPPQRGSILTGFFHPVQLQPPEDHATRKVLDALRIPYAEHQTQRDDVAG